MDISDKYPKYQSYPPTPNWYSSNVTAIVEPHFFLYATRQTIVVLDLNDLKYFTSFIASRDKINAIAAHDTLCYTAGTDKKVRVWSIMSGYPLVTYGNHKAEITALKLIRHNSIAISADKAGGVVLTNPFGILKTTSYTKVKSEITCMATTIVNGKDYVALGYANGMIFVEEIGEDLSMNTVFQLSTENDPIQSLDWQKLPGADKQERWPLLASSTKRKKGISVWAFPSQSLYTTVRLPNPPAQATEQQKASVWIELAWSLQQPDNLYFSAYLGHIHCSNLSRKAPKMIKGHLEKHSRTVFTINWFNEGENCIATSLDGGIAKWDVKKRTCLQFLRTQVAFPYSLDIPKWNEGQLAIGMGDNAIKLWDFSNAVSIMKNTTPHNYYAANVFWKGLQGKIEKIKWHPKREGLIAYGNEYGHVGMYDTFNNKHIPTKTYHLAQTTPFVDWGGNLAEVLEEPEMTDTLLSVGGDGIIHVYDINQPREMPVNLNDRLKEKNEAWFTALEGTDTIRTTLKVDEGCNFIAIGHNNGLVEVYAFSTLKAVFASNYQNKRVQSLDWKNVNGEYFLASGCEDGTVAIHVIKDLDMADAPDILVAEKKPTYCLGGHKSSISELKWSRHREEIILATASHDNFVIVWDVTKEKPLSLFNQHRAQVLSICWNPLDKNGLFSCGSDRFIYTWSYKDFPCAEGFIKVSKTLYDKEMEKFNDNNSNKRKADDSDKRSDTSKETKKKQKAVKKQCGSADMLVSQKSEQQIDRVQKERYCLQLANRLLSGKVEEAANYIKNTHLSEKHLQDTAVMKYIYGFTNDQQQQKQSENIHDLLYGDANDIRQLVDLEFTAIDKQQQPASGGVLFSIKNDMVHNLDTKLALDIMHSQFKMLEDNSIDDTTNICLSDWILLAFSPMAGKQKWIELMLKQGQKLESLHQYHLSASCYIACSRVYDAIEVYRRHSMFREAIIVAKLRLPSNDPIVESLFGDWAKELQKGTEHTLTAICYLLSDIPGAIINAIGALARNGEESALYSAACLAVASNEATKGERIEQWLTKLNERLSAVL